MAFTHLRQVKFLVALPLFLIVFVIPLLVHAQFQVKVGSQNPFLQSSRSSGGGGGEGLQNPLKYGNIYQFLAEVLDVLVQIAFPIIVLFLVYAGFLFVSAQGSEDKINKAKLIFLWTIVGALIILGASVLSRAIEGTINEIRSGAVSDTHPLALLERQ